MQKQPTDLAISTADLLVSLKGPVDDPKCTVRELLTSIGQVSAALSLCGMIHFLL